MHGGWGGVDESERIWGGGIAAKLRLVGNHGSGCTPGARKPTKIKMCLWAETNESILALAAPRAVPLVYCTQHCTVRLGHVVAAGVTPALRATLGFTPALAGAPAALSVRAMVMMTIS